MKKPALFVFFILLATGLTCSLGCTPQPPNDPDALFQDNFSSVFSGWDSYRDSSGVTDYQDGGYRILVNQRNASFWATPGREDKFPADVRVEVEARKLGGPDENLFGLICRYTSRDDLANFYFFAITSSGYVGIYKVTNSVEELLSAGGGMVPSRAVKIDEAVNQIRAECVGDSLALYVNGTLVDSARDASFSSGDIGLIAGATSQRGVDIFFDNLKVTKP
jgi:hypothetical protein